MSHPTRPNSRLLSDKQHLQQLLSSPISKPPLPPLQSSPSTLLPNHQPAAAAAIAPSSLPLPSPEGGVSGVSAPGAKADESKTTSSSNAPPPPPPTPSSSGSGGDKKINNNTTSYVSGGGRLKFFKGKTTGGQGSTLGLRLGEIAREVIQAFTPSNFHWFTSFLHLLGKFS